MNYEFMMKLFLTHIHKKFSFKTNRFGFLP